MNPKSLVHEIERMRKEIAPYRENYPSFYKDMIGHLNNMCVRLLLEGKLIKNLDIGYLNDLIITIKYTKKMMN